MTFEISYKLQSQKKKNNPLFFHLHFSEGGISVSSVLEASSLWPRPRFVGLLPQTPSLGSWSYKPKVQMLKARHFCGSNPFYKAHFTASLKSEKYKLV